MRVEGQTGLFEVGDKVIDERAGYRSAVILKRSDNYTDRVGKPRPRAVPAYQIRYDETGIERWRSGASLQRR